MNGVACACAPLRDDHRIKNQFRKRQGTFMTNHLSRRSVLTGAAGLAAAGALPYAAQADWRPTEAVRIIVPAAPGGPTDVMARLLPQHLQVAWGESTGLENKAGGG